MEGKARSSYDQFYKHIVVLVPTVQLSTKLALITECGTIIM